MQEATNHIKFNRRAGVLLHITSLPGDMYKGNLGHDAYRFIEFLNANGMKVWQVLPVGPTHTDNSPYQCLSAHAGNPELVSLEWLVDRGWLDKSEVKEAAGSREFLVEALKLAGKYFFKQVNEDWHSQYQAFIQKHDYWIEDYALFVVLRSLYNYAPWFEWPVEFRNRDIKALDEIKDKYEFLINQVLFEQFVFFTQWTEIKNYANQMGIELFGDMPIFVSHDSADVWAQSDNFLMDEAGDMEFVAGVPPDAFSETGQRWGNPLYDWDFMQKDGFTWWQERFKTQVELFDLVRIDHFRGLEACWHIPANEEVATNGSWEKVPGNKLLEEIFKNLQSLSLVAEDLGVITDEVIELKNSFNLPGMKVLQFAFDGNTENPHLPHEHVVTDVIYTGTHDNDTTAGWASNESNYNKKYLEKYCGMKLETEEIALMLMRMAIASVSFLVILPMQDLLKLGSDARMNIPGTVDDNWNWRFDWQQLHGSVIDEVSEMLKVYGR